jgi:hypothetical protein
VIANITNLTAVSGTYRTGSVPIQVTFSGPVTVIGTPALTLNTTPTRSAGYTSGSGSSTLVFTYRIQAGDAASDLDAATTSALGLSGGAITSGGFAASLTVPVGSSAGSLATNANVAISTGPTCILTAPISAPVNTPFTLVVTFSTTVTGFTASDLTVTNGSLSNFSGSGTTYMATITPSSIGTLTITMPDSAAVNDNNVPSVGTSTSVTVNAAATTSSSSGGEGSGGGGGCGLGSGVALAGMLLAALSWMRLRRRQAA